MARRHRRLARTVDGRKRVHLDRVDPADTGGVDKDDGARRASRSWGRSSPSSRTCSRTPGTHALLVVLQGRDASGKDGAARKILEYTNVQNALRPPVQGARPRRSAGTTSCGERTAPCRAGATWPSSTARTTRTCSPRGFTSWCPKPVWKRRYEHINAFERLLVDEDVIVLKFCLHVSRGEQVERLLAREKDPRTAWKLNPGDWRELPLWDEFTEAYEDALDRCASPRGAVLPGPRRQEMVPQPRHPRAARARRCGPTASSGSPRLRRWARAR